jgi:hypothetical protein
MKPSRATLVVQAIWELFHYDVVNALSGFHGVHKIVRCTAVARVTESTAFAENEVARALEWAACLYFKPVLCLQRSIVMTSLLRARGVGARFMLGYQAEPFHGHAWVEVNGRRISEAPVNRRTWHVIAID